jgi:hypothetical protein
MLVLMKSYLFHIKCQKKIESLITLKHVSNRIVVRYHRLDYKYD